MSRYLLMAGASLMILAGCETLDRFNVGGNQLGGLDTDGDGVISEQEAQAIPSLAQNFQRIDTNGSGGIDGNEYAAATLRVADVDFGRVDVNGDGVISEREAAAMPSSLKEVFSEVDSDGDSNVSQTEYRAATINLLEQVQFSEVDTDGDGVIGSTEAEEMPVLSQMFDQVDSDGDGLISEDELQAAARR